jgi:hypothetical protein
MTSADLILAAKLDAYLQESLEGSSPVLKLSWAVDDLFSDDQSNEGNIPELVRHAMELATMAHRAAWQIGEVRLALRALQQTPDLDDSGYRESEINEGLQAIDWLGEAILGRPALKTLIESTINDSARSRIESDDESAPEFDFENWLEAAEGMLKLASEKGAEQ